MYKANQDYQKIGVCKANEKKPLFIITLKLVGINIINVSEL